MPEHFIVHDYEKFTQKELNKLCRKYVCAECGEWVEFFWDPEAKEYYLACHYNTRRLKGEEHFGVAKEFTPPDDKSILARREQMSEENVKKDQALVALGVPLSGALTFDQATTVLTTVWKGAPKMEVYKAATICADYGLHPLMNHIYLVAYNKGKPNESWVTVMGIGATRLLMSRQGSFSYDDDTPRIMSEAEQKKIFGKVDQAYVVAITKLSTRDGLHAQGYGKYPKSAGHLMGEDKGNSRENMAFIRSERNAFSRLFPDARQPKEVEVVDERYMELPDGGRVDKSTGEIVEDEAPIPEEEVVEGDFTVVPEDVTPEPEVAPEPAKPRNEDAVTKSQLSELTALWTKLGYTASDVGRMCNKENGWGIHELKDLKVWQYEQLKAIANKELEG